MKVLALSQSFAPGFRGGSFQALTHMVERLGRDCEFWVIARDRDPFQPDPLPGIVVDRWTTHGLARVFYSARTRHPILLSRLMAQAAPDVVFMNSLFATGSIGLLILRRAGGVRVPMIVAPEGELTPGALAGSPGRKRWYLRIARALRLFAGVTWLARDAGEQADIARAFPEASPAFVVPCLGPSRPREVVPALDKVQGAVTLLFLSRITPKKNLTFLLEVLRDDPGGDLDLEIVGPIEDDRYWARCQALIAQLPVSVRVRYRGECAPAEVPGWLARSHAFVLPTLGENYGYVVAEALEAGRPVLVSNQTPWDGLQADRAGWTLPLSADSWRAAIAQLRQMPAHEYQGWCLGARARGVASRPPESTAHATLDVLRHAASTGGR